ALGGLAWCPVDAALEPRIAKTVPAALGHHQSLAKTGEITENLSAVLVQNGGAHRHLEHQIHAAPAGAVAAAALLTAFRTKAALEAEIDQGVEVVIGFHDDAATITAVATVGATPGHELFPTEAQAAIAALARLDLDTGFIYKLHGFAAT